MVFTQKSFSQKIIVLDSTKWLCQYNYEFWQDSTSENSLSYSQMFLQIGSHVSKFTNVTNFLSDSIFYNNIEGDRWVTQDLIANATRGSIGNIMASYHVYKNYPKKGHSLLKVYDEKFYLIEEPMQMKWVLEDNKDSVILGYNCRKAYSAYAGRDYIAWFTTQIPISEGPYKFNGLPGLILKISDSKNQHCFTISSIKKVKYFQPITFSLLNYNDITPGEYIKMMKNKMVRLYGTLQGGMVTFDSEESKAKSLHGLKVKNNFIEKF